MAKKCIMRITIGGGCLWAMLSLVAAPFGWAGHARAGSATLSGLVYEQNLIKPVENALVKIKNLATEKEYQSSPTDKGGAFLIQGIEEGRYSLGVKTGEGDFNFDFELASGVLAVANSRSSTELILLDWHGPLSAGRIYGSPGKQILQEAHCDVAVLRERHYPGEIHRILVSAGGGPHARLGLRLAAQIAQRDDVEMTLLRVAKPSEDLNVEAEMRALHHLAEEALGEPNPRMRARIVVREAIVEGILEETRDGHYDLLVIGASNEWAIKSLLVGAIPDTIADRAPCSVLMVRRYEPAGISTVRRILRSIQGW